MWGFFEDEEDLEYPIWPSEVMMWYLPCIFSVHPMVHIFISLILLMNLINVQIDLDEGTKILQPQLDLAMHSCSAGMTSSW